MSAGPSGTGAPPGIRIEGDLRFGGTATGSAGSAGAAGAAGAAFDLEGLRLTLEAGRWTCLLGPSGVGKSTLLRLIAGLDAGGRLDGSIRASDGAPLAGRIAYMAQTDLLVPWLDILGNVTLGARLRGEAVDRARAEALVAPAGHQ
ncbi:MAG: ATP-binding cassette domain-containing protein, partial [Pseudomonadota bacterium]